MTKIKDGIAQRLTEAGFAAARMTGWKRPNLLTCQAEIPEGMADPVAAFRACLDPEDQASEVRRVPMYPRDIIYAEIPVPHEDEVQLEADRANLEPGT